jgi:hypothetical protein
LLIKFNLYRYKEEMDKEAERVVKEQDMLAKKQSAAMGRGGYGGASGSRGGRDQYYSDGRGGAMDGDFLENDEVGLYKLRIQLPVDS